MDKQALLKSVPEGEDRLLFAKTLDQAVFAIRRKQPTFTDFMNRAKCMHFQERMRGMEELQITLFGGTADCERQKMGFFSEEIATEQFPIAILKIDRKNKKFGQSDLSHRDYLGSILGLGIDRCKVGDILVEEDAAICFVSEEIADYIITMLEQVSKTSVIVKKVENANVSFQRQTQRHRITVASLRIDAVLAELFRLSRAKAQSFIASEKAQVNWNIVTSVSHLLQEGDMVSLRGFGRLRVDKIGGRTKKDKIILEIERYI